MKSRSQGANHSLFRMSTMGRETHEERAGGRGGDGRGVGKERAKEGLREGSHSPNF